MSKFTCLVLCVVAASLSSVHVTKAESLRDSLRPIIEECSKKHGITAADIQAAKDAGSAAGIDLCFVRCVFNKIGFISDKGEYDFETGRNNLKPFVKDEEQYNKLVEVAKQCASVKDKPVSDGTAGCEKAGMVADCFLTHKTSILI